MTPRDARTVLVPGAWMGSWIWDPTADRLRQRGIDAEAITLSGLQPGASDSDIAAVRLDDHIRQVVDRVRADPSRPVVLVSHSYSGMVTASAADQLGDQVVGLVHVGSFLPRDGRSMLEDWGDSAADRAQERADIEAADTLWLAPTREMLDFESDLSPGDRDGLAARLTPHPGRTVLDPATMSTPVEEQPTSYIALTPHGGFEEAWASAPPPARSATHWRRRHLVSAHWPMVSALDATLDLLEAEIRRHSTAEG